MHGSGESQYYLLRDHLDRRRNIHLSLRNGRLRGPRRRTKQSVKTPVSHGESIRVIEIAHVEAKSPVFLEAQEFFPYQVHILGLAIGRQTHQLIFPRVHLESGVVSEGGVQQAQ